MVEDVLLAGFVAVESAHAFSAFNPSIFTIKSFVRSEEDKYKLRLGYIPAVIFGLALSMIISQLIHSSLPLILGIFTMIFMIMAYECAMMEVNG